MAYSRHGRATNRPAEAGSELRPFVAPPPRPDRGRTPLVCPRGQHGPGTTAEKGNEIKAARMRGGGLEPDGGTHQAWIFKGFASAGVRR
jgi:hypothetical protein